MKLADIFMAVTVGVIGVAYVGKTKVRWRPSSREIALRQQISKPTHFPNRLWQTSATILGASVAMAILPLHSFSASVLLGSAFGWTLSGMTMSTYRKSRAKKVSHNFELALIAFIEQLSLKVTSGNSMHSALILLGDADNAEVAYFQKLLRAGLDIASAAKLWVNRIDSAPKRRFIDALSPNATAAETLGLLDSLLSQLRDEQRFALIADIERREQLVWIPVSIAVLVPGMIFIAIPLQATLHNLLG